MQAPRRTTLAQVPTWTVSGAWARLPVSQFCALTRESRRRSCLPGGAHWQWGRLEGQRGRGRGRAARLGDMLCAEKQGAPGMRARTC